MPAPTAVIDLVARFHANLDSYKRGLYNETQVRREFIDPFFEALGWDVANRQGYAEAYKDVVHEEAIKVGGGTKAPDYGFRIGGTRKFFVEAKKPSVDLKADVHPAYQLRRYAWSAKLPLSILTDFEEFAVYDCRVKPDKGDKPSTARVMYLTFDQYADRWDEIAGVFARDAILKGSFDKYAEAKGGKRGTAEVDAAFLAEIERWRDLLAHNIALRNPALSQRELNFAVQQTIDRIIFLRICEDRGIEPYGTLLGLVNGAEVYGRLLLRFRHADARYNSGLFYFETDRRGRGDAPDTLTPRLAIDDKVLADILKSLYYPDSPYEFSVLPGDILGQVYEQFLGKVIRLTAGHRAVVEEKPEVARPAAFSTRPPTSWIPSCVRPWASCWRASRCARSRAWPPATGARRPPCGSRTSPAAPAPSCWARTSSCWTGTWPPTWPTAPAGPQAGKWATGRNPRLYQNGRGEWRLTIGERKRILLDHIYGVDIDPQAVEVTKLSLLLKVLEGEDEQTIGQQLALFPERALPDLGRNIKCGNSLVGPDFYANGQQMALLTDEEALRVNVFDWAGRVPAGLCGRGVRRHRRQPAVHPHPGAQGMGAAGGGVLQAPLPRRQQGQLRHLRGLRRERAEPAQRARPAGLHPAATSSWRQIMDGLLASLSRRGRRCQDWLISAISRSSSKRRLTPVCCFFREARARPLSMPGSSPQVRCSHFNLISANYHQAPYRVIPGLWLQGSRRRLLENLKSMPSNCWACLP